MKAITFHQFGSVDVLQQETVPSPPLKDDHVLVRVRASSVNVIDSRVREGKMGILVNSHFPKIPGSDLAGEVESVGSHVTAFQPGNKVFGATAVFGGGAFAEYASVPAGGLAIMPPSLSFEQAAAVPICGLAALYSVRDLGKAQQDSRILIHGSSGGAGLFAIQIARVLGAHVTAVCGTSGVELCRAMGANLVLDYTKSDLPLQGPYDVIANFSGRLPFDDARHLLTEDGRYIDPSPTIPQFIGSKLANPFRHQKDLMLQTEAKTEDLNFLSGLIESGALKITIAKTFAIDEAKEAFRAQEAGGVLGKIVVTVP